MNTFSSDVFPAQTVSNSHERRRAQKRTTGAIAADDDLALQLHIMMSAGMPENTRGTVPHTGRPLPNDGVTPVVLHLGISGVGDVVGDERGWRGDGRGGEGGAERGSVCLWMTRSTTQPCGNGRLFHVSSLDALQFF